MSEGQKTAAWIVFVTLGAGALGVLINWVFCLTMNAVVAADRFEAEPLWSFAICALVNGTGIGSLIAWTWWRRRPKGETDGRP